MPVTERYARECIHKLPVPLTWVEQAHGGTVGGPDVFIHAGGITMPTELKCWGVNAKGTHWVTKLKREQVRYHHVMAKARNPTLLVWCSPTSKDLWAMGGHLAPHTVHSTLWRGNAMIEHYAQPHQLETLLHHIATKHFWPVNQGIVT